MEEVEQKFLEMNYSLSPLFSFIEEIKNVKRSRRISEDSTISMLDLLTLEIKEDVITTVRAMQIEESKKWTEVEDQFKESYKDIRDKLYDQSQTMSNLEMDFHSLGDMISRQGGYIENQNKNFDIFRKDLNEKATNNDLIDFKKQLKRYTPIGDFHHLSNQVMECANKSSVDLIRKELLNLEKRVKIYITQEELYDFTKKSEESSKSFATKTFLPTEKFNEEKDFIVKRFDRLEEDIHGLFQKVENYNEAVKKKFKEIFELIKRRPWDPDVQHLQGQIDECSTKNEFQRLCNYVNPKIDGFSLAVAEFTGKIFQFEKIIERYDEIILEKASKDDVKQINSKIPSFALVSNLKEVSDRIRVETEYNSDKFYEIKHKTEEVSSHISTIFQRIEAIRRENIEVSSVASTLVGISEKLTEKADKSDIYLIYDVMGRKEDIVAIKDADDIFKKQVEMIVIILQSLCRTFLDSGDTPNDLKKQRFHLYRNLKGLLAWINGDEPAKARVTPGSKSPLNLKTEIDLETSAEFMNSGRLGRRFRRSVMTTSPRSKGSVDFVNLPPLS